MNKLKLAISNYLQRTVKVMLIFTSSEGYLPPHPAAHARPLNVELRLCSPMKPCR